MIGVWLLDVFSERSANGTMNLHASDSGDFR
jgi:hypothetical protein